MQRLSGLDASFLYLETPASYMHVASLMIFDPATAADGWSFERARAYYAERLHFAPPFRRRLVEVPFGLHHPIWIEDPDFDLDRHLHHIAVPKPGGHEQLARLAAEIVATQLDRSRPLWEVWFIEGVEGDKVAVLTKTHHAALDGVSGNDMTVAFLDLSADAPPPAPPEQPWTPDHVPSDAEMLGYAMSSLARQPVKVARAARHAMATAFDVRRVNRSHATEPPPSPFSAPRTSWTGALTPRRDYSMISLPLEQVKAVKNAFGATVNDVVLAVCAGSLRRYLDKHGETVDSSLVTMVPVSVRAADQRGVQDNRVSMMLATLATDIDDPVERLAVISAGMQRAKQQQELIGAAALQDWTEFAAPAVAANAARLYARLRLADRHRPVFNLTISNVPGPAFPLYSMGMQMTHYYPMGPINDGAGLNITVLSYMGKLDFGIVTCKDLLPAASELSEGLSQALDELTALIPT